MNRLKPYSFLFVLLAGLGLLSCTEEGGKETEVKFDRQAMLTNIGQNIIFPAYANFSQKATALEEAVHDFTEAPDVASLTTAQEALKGAYMAWQKVSLYEFGPAEAVALRMSVNTFPTDFPAIESNITSGSWNLNFYSSLSKKGLPALDYLLYAGESQEEIVAGFSTAEHAANRRQYLHDVADQLARLATEVYNGWAPEGGNYLGTFSTTTDNSAGSPLSLFVNQFNEGYEVIKNKKLGLPLGIRSIQNEPIPGAVEAYYSGISLELMEANLRSVEASFKGEANGTNGPGLDDYLTAIYLAGSIQDDLSSDILHQLNKAQQAVASINGPLSEAVVSDAQTARMAYDELQDLVVLIKTDMPSALGVLISYIDNDGD